MGGVEVDLRNTSVKTWGKNFGKKERTSVVREDKAEINGL